MCTRINHLAPNRPDILFDAKETARLMLLANNMVWEMAKRCGRYLLCKPRMVQRFATQPPVDTLTLKIDSDHAGFLRTWSTVGIGGDHGKHVIRAASTTQTVIAVVKWGVTKLRDCAWHSDSDGHEEHGQKGHEAKVALETDTVSGRGMLIRLGAWMVRLVDTQWWVHGQRFGTSEEPAMKQTS